MLNCSVDFLIKMCAAEDTVAGRMTCSVWERRVLYECALKTRVPHNDFFDFLEFKFASLFFLVLFFYRANRSGDQF